MFSLPVLSMIELKEVTDIDVQLWHFVIRAATVIVISWVWIRMHRWLALAAMAIALLSASAILNDLWWTEGWLDKASGEQLIPGYLPTGLCAAMAPIVAITFLLLTCTADRKRPPLPFLLLVLHYSLGTVSILTSLVIVIIVLTSMRMPDLAPFLVGLVVVIGLWLTATFSWFRTRRINDMGSANRSEAAERG